MQKLELFKAGHYQKQLDYKAFMPVNINQAYIWEDRELMRLSEKATLVLGQLDAYADLVPNIDHFIRMYVTKEATVSSKIEGTQTNMEQALMSEKDINPEMKNDWKEVNNYIQAMNLALENLHTLPLSSRMLRQCHYELMQNVRGEHKLPGEFRSSQNWIGGRNLSEASFVPPIWQEVQPLMGDLEKFVHNEDTGLPHVLKIALAHYQFETIHPFLDGNGRVGRLLITLYLVSHGILHKPVLYLSDYFEKRRFDYYDNLTRVRQKNELIVWLKFFCQGVIETANSAINSLKEIIALKKECEENRIYGLGKKVSTAKNLLDYLFQMPIVDAHEVSRITSLSLVSTYKLIADFVQLKILKEMTGQSRNRLFVFDEYFTIFKN